MSVLALVMALAIQTPPAPVQDPRPSPMASAPASADQAAVEATLDRMHQAASRADGAVYFDQYATDARFIGTDAGERWTLAEFRAYAEPHFAKGRGWTYHPRDRVVQMVGDWAWFDEVLDHDSYGVLRGSGLLRKADGRWKIEQYVLSFAVPNDVADDVVALIQQQAAQAAGAGAIAARPAD